MTTAVHVRGGRAEPDRGQEAELPTAAALPLVETEQRATARGYVLLLLGLSLALSAIPELRIRIAGLHAHVYVLILVVAALGLLFDRRTKPANLSMHGAGALFAVVALVTNLLAEDKGDALPICVKWLTVLFTFYVAARLPHSRADLDLATYGLIVGVAAIGARGMFLHQQDPTYYLETMRGIGSRNTFSMWTLAPLMYSAWLVASNRLRIRTKLMLLVAISAMVVPQALSLSRSGWLLIAAAFACAFLGRRSLRSLFAGLIAATVIFWAVSQLEFFDKAESRFNDLRTGTESDEFRLNIVKGGFDVFFENPVFGVSQANIPYELGRATRGRIVNSHNLFVEILAGMGLAGVVSLGLCVIVLLMAWRAAMRVGNGQRGSELSTLLLPLLALGALRAVTSEELVYNPAFIMGLAIAFAACRMNIALGQQHAQHAHAQH
jgi:O-antigen ligase